MTIDELANINKEYVYKKMPKQWRDNDVYEITHKDDIEFLKTHDVSELPLGFGPRYGYVDQSGEVHRLEADNPEWFDFLSEYF